MSDIAYERLYPKCLSRTHGGQPEKLTLRGEPCNCDCYFGRLNSWYDVSRPDPHRPLWPIDDPRNVCRLLPRSVYQYRRNMEAQRNAQEWQRFIHDFGGNVMRGAQTLVTHVVNAIIPDTLCGNIGAAVNIRAFATAGAGAMAELARLGWGPLSGALRVLPQFGASALDLNIITALELMIMKGSAVKSLMTAAPAGAAVTFSASIDRWANLYLGLSGGIGTLGAAASAMLIYAPHGAHGNEEGFKGWYIGDSFAVQTSTGPDPGQIGAIVSTDGRMGMMVGIGTPGAGVGFGHTWYICNLVRDIDWSMIARVYAQTSGM